MLRRRPEVSLCVSVFRRNPKVNSMKYASICAIDYYLPSSELTTGMLAQQFPDWSIESLEKRTGIHTRRIVGKEECASDLAVEAANKLFETGQCERRAIDFILYCTQSPDYIIPTTACMLQDRLGISKTAGALDYNLGCSGFVYGLALCEGLIASNQAERILLLTADTYSKYLNPMDRNSRTIFGDGAAAVFVSASEMDLPSFGPAVYGTDGSHALALALPNSGTRKGEIEGGARRNGKPSLEGTYLVMDGKRIVDFALEAVPDMVESLLKKADISRDAIDLFVFHQANAFIVEELGSKLGIPKEKCPFLMGDGGNTVSATIPMTLKRALDAGLIKDGDRIMLIGFGVGLSWAARILTWISR